MLSVFGSSRKPLLVWAWPKSNPMDGSKRKSFSFRGSNELDALVVQFQRKHGLPTKGDALRTLVCEALAERDMNPDAPAMNGHVDASVASPPVGEEQRSLDPKLAEALAYMLERLEDRITDSKNATFELGRAIMSNLLQDDESRDAARAFLDQAFNATGEDEA